MSQSKSAEEVRQGYIAAMGEELGVLFHAIWSELTWIHWRWRQYRILFGEKQSRIDLLKEAAAGFFRAFQKISFEDTLLAIARLIGPAESCNKPNLAVERFPPLLADPKFQTKVRGLIDKAKASGKFAVDWRNRRIAHRDLNLVLRRSPRPLDAATREKVEGSLSALRDILHAIETRYCNAETAYADPEVPGDAESLLYVIREGLQRRQERRARRERGDFREDDVKSREPI